MSTRQNTQGDNNVQTIGNNNITINNSTFNYYEAKQAPLSQSLIYELLDIVYTSTPSTNSEYSLRDPAEMHDKLKFNNARRYIGKIDNHSDDYARVCDVIHDRPDSETIIKRLRDMFFDVAKLDDNGEPIVADGDKQLDQIKQKLVDTITTDARYDASAYPIEKVEQFCIALIAYGVFKCQVLKRPE